MSSDVHFIVKGDGGFDLAEKKREKLCILWIFLVHTSLLVALLACLFPLSLSERKGEIYIETYTLVVHISLLVSPSRLLSANKRRNENREKLCILLSTYLC